MRRRPTRYARIGVDGHPLAPVLHELHVADPDRHLELSGDRGFVDAFIDAEPNDVDDSFRDRLFAYTDERNARAQALLEHLGFRCEGRFRESHWFRGVWASERLYAQLASERPEKAPHARG